MFYNVLNTVFFVLSLSFIGVMNWMCALKTQCCNLKLQRDGIWRWGLCEVVRFKWGQESEAPMMGLVSLWNEEVKLELPLFLSLPVEDTGRRQLSLGQKRPPPGTESAWTLILDFPASRTVRNVSCLSHSVYGILLEKPEPRHSASGLCGWCLSIVENSQPLSLQINRHNNL